MASLTSHSATTVGAFTAEVFAAHLARVQHLPAWWLDRKRTAYARFAALPFPKRTDEGWRFSHLSGLSLDGYQLAAPINHQQVTKQDLGAPGAGTLLLANHQVVYAEPLVAKFAQQGVIFTTLQEALLKHSDL
ncbi:MAG: Fe-S cluster assembly protein SufD, partial [Opitutaceae bacterium]|nr:Fe-S cluster assembly protein SufD [Opitutaceae bacterium]